MLGMNLSINKFPDWLQSELDKRQWSQADLAYSAGISRAVVNKLLNRRTYPQPDTLQAIARAFKIPVETVYRAAGLLPQESEVDTFAAEIIHKLKLIKDPERRKTAIRLLKALIDVEESGGSLNYRVPHN
jgi:transcriptional regulator with XRE-family HTH domain